MGAKTYLLTDCLSPYAHEKLVEKMKNSRGFSLLCDKATDITMSKTFCVNVRYVISGKCEPITRFHRLLPVGKDEGADALFELLTKTFAEDWIEWKNWLCIRWRKSDVRREEFVADTNKSCCARFVHY